MMPPIQYLYKTREATTRVETEAIPKFFIWFLMLDRYIDRWIDAITYDWV